MDALGFELLEMGEVIGGGSHSKKLAKQERFH
jgi:hypothetical protein